MSVLLVLLLFAVMQVAVYFYARNVVVASVADAARYAATEGVPPAEGGRRALHLVRDGLDERDASGLRCVGRLARDEPSGLTVETVHCRGRIRFAFSPLPFPLTIEARSSVLREGTQ